MKLEQSAQAFAHELVLATLLSDFASAHETPKEYLHWFERRLLNSLPGFRAIQEAPDGLHDLCADRISAIVRVAAGSLDIGDG